MTIALIFTLIILREILRQMSGDYTTSVIPGWHTTVYPTEWILTMVAILILLVSGITMSLFKLIKNIMEKIWKTIEKNKG